MSRPQGHAAATATDSDSVTDSATDSATVSVTVFVTDSVTFSVSARVGHRGLPTNVLMLYRVTMKRFHIAIAVHDVEASVAEYSKRIDASPCVLVPGEYALWRTNTLNLSIRKTLDAPGTVRHVGWEDPEAARFSEERDLNGLLWERFNALQQWEEILSAWPEAKKLG